MKKAVFLVLGFILFVSMWYANESARRIMTTSDLSIGFMGDVMLGRTINEILSVKGNDYIWGDTRDILKNLDLTVINLETALTASTDVVPKVFNFKADPEHVHSLTSASIKVANLANNHILDFSISGLVQTLETLDKAGIGHVGAGKNLEEARKPLIIEKNNIKLGIIGFTDNEPEWKAGPNRPGTNYSAVGDLAAIEKQIVALRPQVDVVIITCHWGPNMRQRPSEEYQQFAHALIDFGADIIQGHSAHLFQAIELYKSKIIFYDTGDFIDDYAIDPILRNDQSFIFKVVFTQKKLTKIELIPVLIKNFQVNLARGTEADEIVQKMRRLCAEFGTHVTEKGEILLAQ